MINEFEIVVPTLLGVEAITAREIRGLGYETTDVSDGRITFKGDFSAVARANIWVRSGDRVLIKVGEFKAVTFDELFEKSKNLPWSEWLPKDAKFPIKGFSFKSALFSTSDCQSIIKKSIVASMQKSYNMNWFPETGDLYQLQFSIMRDIVTIMIDTTGQGLHKRGYRPQANEAPIKETLAASMVSLSGWRPDKPFADPFCGSGTFPIEAALIARNIAPGLHRSFAAQKISAIPKEVWTKAKEEANSVIKKDISLDITASDIDENAIYLTKLNSKYAGVDKDIKAFKRPLSEFKSDSEKGTLMCNPPYGERLGDIEEAEKLYKELGEIYKNLNNWALFAITSNESFETLFGKKADKKRKLYNGMIKCNFYQYFFTR